MDFNVKKSEFFQSGFSFRCNFLLFRLFSDVGQNTTIHIEHMTVHCI